MTPYILGLDAPFVCPQITHHILKLHNCTIITYRTQPAGEELRIVGGRDRIMGSSDIVITNFWRNIKC
jgi:hypothetical protein